MLCTAMSALDTGAHLNRFDCVFPEKKFNKTVLNLEEDLRCFLAYKTWQVWFGSDC